MVYTQFVLLVQIGTWIENESRGQNNNLTDLLLRHFSRREGTGVGGAQEWGGGGHYFYGNFKRPGPLWCLRSAESVGCLVGCGFNVTFSDISAI